MIVMPVDVLPEMALQGLNPTESSVCWYKIFFLSITSQKKTCLQIKLTQDPVFQYNSSYGKNTCLTQNSSICEVSYHFPQQKTMQGDIRISGIGDANVMRIYQILMSKILTTNERRIGIKDSSGVKFDERELPESI